MRWDSSNNCCSPGNAALHWCGYQKERECWMENAVQEQHARAACSTACPAACWVTAKLRATVLGFFHVCSELLSANNLFLASLFPCFFSHRNASTSQQPPLCPAAFTRASGVSSSFFPSIPFLQLLGDT